MPMTYCISRELNLVIFICKGSVTGDDLIQAVSASLEDPLRVTGMMNVLDTLDASDELELGDLQAVFELEKKIRTRKDSVKMAVISFSDGVKLLVSAISLISKGMIEAEVFQEIHSASVWLGMADIAAVEKFWSDARA